MTIKEITALRKSGQLTEALEAAENEFARNVNIYTVGALFWCLNDISKQQTGDDAAATVERMRSLYNDYCENDEYMQKALASADRRCLPHFIEVKDAVENAKNGADAIAAHSQIATWYNEGNLDARLYSDFGWLTYYALKQTGTDEVQKRKILLYQYLKLNLPRPSILHSLILGEAVKTEQKTPLQFRIRDFVRIWGLENLRDEDWEQFRTDGGNTLPSLVEKLVGVYTKELKTDGVKSPEDFSQLIDKALIKYPNSQNMPYFKAIWLISQGKAGEALTYYKDLIMRFPSKFYLWNQTAELVEDIDTKIGLLCKALKCGTDDEFLGAVRLRLASLLLQKNLKANAVYEIEKYRETYQNKGWNLKTDYWQIYNQLKSVESVADNNALYTKYAVKADEFIYSSLPTIVAIKVSESQTEDRYHPGRKVTAWTLRTRETTLKLRKPAKFGLDRHTSNGTPFDVKMLEDKIVWIKRHSGDISESWLKEASGEVHFRIDRNGKKYAMISGSYVGENLLRDIKEGQMIKILSVQQNNGRWSAVSILKQIL